MTARTKQEGNKYTHSLIGPVSERINIATFIQDVQNNRSLCSGTDEGLIHQPFLHLDKDQKAEIEARCSVADFKAEAQQHFVDDNILTELKLWQWARAYAGSDDNDRLVKAIQEAGTPAKSRKLNMGAKESTRKRKKATEEDAEMEASINDEILIDPALDESPQEPETSAAAAKKGKGKAANGKKKALDVDPILGPGIDTVRNLLLDTELRSNQAISAYHYFRKTRISDTQSLSQLRTPFIPAFMSYATTDEALDHFKTTALATEVLISVTIHPIWNKLGTYRDNVTIPARLQQSVFLASQTLADLRDAIVSVPTAVPALRTQDDSSQVTLEDTATTAVKPKYVNSKWKAGGVMCIGGKLYPDLRDGRPDYADLLLRLLSRATNSSDAPAAAQVDLMDPLDTPLYVQPGSQPLNYSKANRSMHETTFMDLLGGLRLGEPCLLWQHGNDERVFSFEGVRLLHHTDPAPVLPRLSPQVSPYPITTYLSRLSVNKCMVCERDPATKMTINDELAGVTPCPMCDACLGYLHGSEDAALRNGVQVIPILEELD